MKFKKIQKNSIYAENGLKTWLATSNVIRLFPNDCLFSGDKHKEITLCAGYSISGL
jgi:hypothetical protein